MKYLEKQLAQGIKKFPWILKNSSRNNDNFPWGRAQVPHAEGHLL
jgi:hypothetical protein